MSAVDSFAESIEELNTRHAAEYIGLIWVKASNGNAVVREKEEGELLYFAPLSNNSDAYTLACRGNLWQSDYVAQAYNHEAYTKDPEGEKC
mgnify:FL=1